MTTAGPAAEPLSQALLEGPAGSSTVVLGQSPGYWQGRRAHAAASWTSPSLPCSSPAQGAGQRHRRAGPAAGRRCSQRRWAAQGAMLAQAPQPCGSWPAPRPRTRRSGLSVTDILRPQGRCLGPWAGLAAAIGPSPGKAVPQTPPGGAGETAAPSAPRGRFRPGRFRPAAYGNYISRQAARMRGGWTEVGGAVATSPAPFAPAAILSPTFTRRPTGRFFFS